MFRIRGIILCLCFIMGLLSTGISSSPVHKFSIQEWTGFLIFIVITSSLVTIFLPRFWLFSPQRIWLLSGSLIILLAVVYFQLRIPSPNTNNISYQLNKFEGNFSPLVEVSGKIISNPKLTRKDKIQFIVKVNEIKLSSETTEEVTGKIYVSVPLLQGTGLYSSQKVILKGKLYQPFTEVNPGGFNFQTYLLKQGIFAGFIADEVKITAEGNAINWGLWHLRKRIIRTHLYHLKVPIGNVISSIVLGRREVYLPYEINDLFIRVGLVHILSVSGFHVSLWLSAILFLTKSFSPKSRLIIGILGLLIYLLFTGFYPSVLRATLMGSAMLIGIVNERRVNSLNSLILAATILLLINPLWIWDLGFQLSFLATLGLIVTLPAIIDRLDYLPPYIATLIAVPVSASIWVLPLQSYAFNTLAVYGILVNIIVAPLVVFISLGAMITAFIGVFLPLIGSAIAFLLYYPTLSLIKIVEVFDNLPGNLLATGKIPIGILIFSYAVFLSIWLIPSIKKRWRLTSLLLLTTFVLTIILPQIGLIQITVLATKSQPIIVIQNKGETTLINKGNKESFNYTLLPFLTNQGINKIDNIVIFNKNEETNKIQILSLKSIAIDNVFNEVEEAQKNDKYINLNTDKSFLIDKNNKLNLIANNPPILELNIIKQKWIFLPEKISSKLPEKLEGENVDVLLWSGINLNYNWLNKFKPKVAISFRDSIDSKTKKTLEDNKTKTYSTKTNGAIQYTPKTGFKPYLEEYDIMISG